MHHHATRAGIGALLLLSLALSAGTALAQSNEDSIIGMYLTEARAACGRLDPVSCEDEDNELSGSLFTPYYAVLCVFKGDPLNGVAGLSLGLEYDSRSNSGVDIFQWNLCANLEFANQNWPNAGGGNRITWIATTNCQIEEPGVGEGVTAIAGHFYLTAYGNDRFEITPNQGVPDPELGVANCSSVMQDVQITQAGSLGFSDDESKLGNLPCAGPPTEEVTWGRIKSTYNNR